eukprot:m.119783 g.119783  ORF g.119783 m.119783 type:complete len:153 (-) comp12913_c0_seq3:2068-2526(-)
MTIPAMSSTSKRESREEIMGEETAIKNVVEVCIVHFPEIFPYTKAHLFKSIVENKLTNASPFGRFSPHQHNARSRIASDNDTNESPRKLSLRSKKLDKLPPVVTQWTDDNVQYCIQCVFVHNFLAPSFLNSVSHSPLKHSHLHIVSIAIGNK